MHFVTLFYQPGKSTSHRDDVVVWMGTEDQDSFRIRIGSFGTGRIICIGFASRPTCNGVLHVVEYLDIYFIGRTESLDQIGHPIVDVVFVFYFQDRLFHFLAQPDDGFSDQLVVPLYFADQPGLIGTRQFFGCTFVDDELYVRMYLQKSGRDSIRNTTFDRSFDDRSFFLTPSQEYYFPGFHNRTHSHGNGAGRHIFHAAEISCSILDRQIV